MGKSTSGGENAKPAKPRPDFPLFPHQSGRWCKKIKGKFHYFGKVADDPRGEKALEKWLDERDDLLAGRTPQRNRDGLNVRDLVNAFLRTKKSQAAIGEIAPVTFADYLRAGKRTVAVLGQTTLVRDLTPSDFERLRDDLAKTRGPVGLGNEIQRIRVLFKYAYDQALVDSPVRFGQAFKKPGRRVLRRLRAAAGPKMFEADELRAIIEAAGTPLKAIVLLAINTGFGQSDVASLPIGAVDLKGGWVDFPRPKTGIERRAPLWPETIEAMQAALAARPAPKDEADAGLFFITSHGRRWVRFKVTEKTDDAPRKEAWIDAVALEFGKILRNLKLSRPGRGFYSIRRTFETIGGDTGDQVATSYIMGHADESMAAVYRQRIEDARLRKVTDHVRAWLFPAEESK